MKGHLYKKEQPKGWYVVYDIDGFTKGELPLHPEYQTILPLDLDLEGNEVEFDWCVIVEHYTGKGKEYAKLLDKKSEYPELEGTNALCDDIIEKRTGKMTEEEWQAAERAQTSSRESWEGCDGCTEQDEVMYKNGYVKGYQAGYNRAVKVIEDEIQRVLKDNI